MTKEIWQCWCQEAVAQIKYGPDRHAVQQELEDHLEDHYEDYLAAGLSESEAEVRALEAMGSAEEIAPQLAAIHKPFWGYLLSITQYLLIGMMFLMVTSLLTRMGQQEIYDPDKLYQEMFDYDPYVVGGSYGSLQYQGGPPIDAGKSILYLEPEEAVSSDGYIFCISRAAVWKHALTKTFHFQIKVTNPRIWADPSDAPRWFWAIDSEGNSYPSAYKTYWGEEDPSGQSGIDGGSEGDAQRGIRGARYRTGLTEYTYEMWIPEFESEGIQWIEFHYDRAGRDLVMRVDLTKGGTP